MKETMMAAVAVACIGVGTARAQTAVQVGPPAARVFIAADTGYQLTASDFADGAVRRENAEDGRFDTSYTIKAGPSFDVAGGTLLWRRIAVGVALSRFSVATPGELTATVPHPFFFNRPRSISGQAAALRRDELIVHLQARLIVPAGRRFQVMVFGGPSFFRVKQDVITDFTYTESYPYDDAEFAAATTTTERVAKAGLNVGGDLSYFLTPSVGVGATVRFSGTTVELPVAPDRTQMVKVGGTQMGVGLRLRF